jgi:hypothetical protein
MAEIPALHAAQIFALQSDAKTVREQQEQARARLESLRQNNLDIRNGAVLEQTRAKELQLERQRQDLREADQIRARQRADRIAREFEISDHRRFIDQTNAADRERRSAEANADVRFFADRRSADRAVQPFAAPETPNPNEFNAPRPFDVGEITQPPPAPDRNGLGFFEIQQQERDLRLAERRGAARDAAIQQQFDLQLAGDRIDSVPPNPDLPRGSIVDVFG